MKHGKVKTQHGGLASWEGDQSGRNGRRGRDGETGIQGHLPGRSRSMKKTKTVWNLHVKKGLSLVDYRELVIGIQFLTLFF